MAIETELTIKQVKTDKAFASAKAQAHKAGKQAAEQFKKGMEVAGAGSLGKFFDFGGFSEMGGALGAAAAGLTALTATIKAVQAAMALYEREKQADMQMTNMYAEEQKKFNSEKAKERQELLKSAEVLKASAGQTLNAEKTLDAQNALDALNKKYKDLGITIADVTGDTQAFRDAMAKVAANSHADMLSDMRTEMSNLQEQIKQQKDLYDYYMSNPLGMAADLGGEKKTAAMQQIYKLQEELNRMRKRYQTESGKDAGKDVKDRLDARSQDRFNERKKKIEMEIFGRSSLETPEERLMRQAKKMKNEMPKYDFKGFQTMTNELTRRGGFAGGAVFADKDDVNKRILNTNQAQMKTMQDIYNLLKQGGLI